MTDKSKIYTSDTENVRINILPKYEELESNPAIGKFIHSYHVTIINSGNFSIKLLSRHWHIVDSIQIRREVKGEGVIGLQPIINPGMNFEYQSWCPLNSPIGKMYGSYLFQNLADGSEFEVDTPEFLLISDFKLN
jgi:ApaG protein